MGDLKKRLKICLFMPWCKSKGGAEAVVLAFLKNTKYDIDIYTWAYDKEKTFPDFKNYNIKVIAPPFVKSLSRLFLLRSLLLFFSKLPVEDYDLLLLSTSGVAEIILLRNKPKKTVAYCHTILRAANFEDVRWNMDNKYKNPLMKLVYYIAVKFYNLLEKMSWKHIDIIIFNSELSKQRAERKGLIPQCTFFTNNFIINPPVRLDKFLKAKPKKGHYFFYPSRFNKPKRQELLIDAWRVFQEKHPEEVLILAGSIEKQDYYDYLKQKAKGLNITFRPNISDEEMIKLYANCKAGIFVPFVEDFGIVPFEFIVLRKPLIAVDRGGYIPLVNDYPLFFPIIERVDDYLMIQEINTTLERFIRLKTINRKEYKVQVTDEKEFASKIDKILER
jgi:glycosyltransferase involved in cell wall biosynthesis